MVTTCIGVAASLAVSAWLAYEVLTAPVDPPWGDDRQARPRPPLMAETIRRRGFHLDEKFRPTPYS